MADCRLSVCSRSLVSEATALAGLGSVGSRSAEQASGGDSAVAGTAPGTAADAISSGVEVTKREPGRGIGERSASALVGGCAADDDAADANRKGPAAFAASTDDVEERVLLGESEGVVDAEAN